MRERGAGAHRHVGCCRTEHGERLRTIRASVPAEKSHLPTCVKSTSSCGTRPRGSPERHHSHYPALGRPIRPYEWTVQPRGERDRTQLCHGSPDESGQSSLSGDWARMARIAKKKFVHSTTSYVAIGEYASAVPGSHRAWSGDPARALHAWRTAPTR